MKTVIVFVLALLMLAIPIAAAEDSVVITISDIGEAHVIEKINDIENIYDTNKLTKKRGNTWTFSYSINFEEKTDVRVLLPFNVETKSVSHNGRTSSEFGRLIVDWNIKGKKTLEVKYVNSGENYPIFIASFVAIVLILFGLAYLKKRPILRPKETKKKPKEKKEAKKEEKFTERQRDLIKTLPVKEKEIIDVLFKKNKITQKALARETTLPKSTLSRTLKKLKAKNIIEIDDYGTTKMIRLSDWFLEK
ncbi:MAG: winged helix-turn-helix transcriptional regulator [Candidatus Aenigmarchaeota archaeon]|nr:winged helix-turn-helix transcriptional regulator [Candidatus Aenigmarchaeota archaeon]